MVDTRTGQSHSQSAHPTPPNMAISLESPTHLPQARQHPEHDDGQVHRRGQVSLGPREAAALVAGERHESGQHAVRARQVLPALRVQGPTLKGADGASFSLLLLLFSRGWIREIVRAGRSTEEARGQTPLPPDKTKRGMHPTPYQPFPPTENNKSTTRT